MNGQAVLDPERREASHETLVFLLVAIGTMLFMTFTAAYLIRRTGSDWVRAGVPAWMWVNTGVLLASSVAVEAARRRGSRAMLGVTLALGLVFAAGQVAAWKALADGGMFLTTSPHASFVYTLTAVHALHVLGGLAAIAAALAGRLRPGLAAAWWHFVDGLWLYLLVLLCLL